MSTAPRTLLEKRYATLGLMLIAPTVVVFCSVIVYPLLSAIYLSFFSIFTPTLEGDFVGLSNYCRAAADRGFLVLARHTLIWTVGTLTPSDRDRRRHGAGAAPEHLVPQPCPLADPVSLFHLHRRGGAGLEMAVQRSLRDHEPPADHAGLIDLPMDYLGTMPNAMISVILVGAGSISPLW
jgi:multiple sugar transport system permease protein